MTTNPAASTPFPTIAPTTTDTAASAMAVARVPICVNRIQACFLVSSEAMMISVAAKQAADTAAMIWTASGRDAVPPVLVATPPANDASAPKSARIARARSHVYTNSTAPGRRSCSSSREVTEFGTRR